MRPRWSPSCSSGSPDCLVVAAYGQILPADADRRPAYGSVNVHASLLPRWRGASPIAHAILAGDAETGRVDHAHGGGSRHRAGVRDGARARDGPDATTPALTRGSRSWARRSSLAVLGALERGEAWRDPAARDRRHVRAAARARRRARRLGRAQRRRGRSDGPCAATMAGCGGAARRRRRPDRAGAVATDVRDGEPGRWPGMRVSSVVIAAWDGGYRIDLITPPGKRAMTPAAFLRGRRAERVLRDAAGEKARRQPAGAQPPRPLRVQHRRDPRGRHRADRDRGEVAAHRPDPAARRLRAHRERAGLADAGEHRLVPAGQPPQPGARAAPPPAPPQARDRVPRRARAHAGADDHPAAASTWSATASRSRSASLAARSSGTSARTSPNATPQRDMERAIKR